VFSKTITSAGSWFYNEWAEEIRKFQVELDDCAETRLVFVNPPEHPDALGSADGMSLKKSHRAHVTEWSERFDIPLVDINLPSPFSSLSFADALHLRIVDDVQIATQRLVNGMKQLIEQRMKRLESEP
jgi:hypothetical protein